jgi:tRNA A-37 threonylcarbamoyl transferase component Bud32
VLGALGSTVPPQPDHIGPYRVLRKLGEGGMGLVLEAVHTKIERRVAIKLLLPEYARDALMTERLFREALAVNRIEHPCVVQISEHGQLPDGTVYLVMEYLRGQTLAAWMEQHPGPAPVRMALGLMVQITSALAAAHDKQVVHRDLKPDNLMLLEDVAGLSEPGTPRVKILDFGIAKVSRESLQGQKVKTATNALMGTPQYMAPEQGQGAIYASDKSDVYSLGVILFELLTGRLPFDAPSVEQLIGMHLFKEPPRLRELAPSVPGELAELVQGMLAKEKAARPTMRELQREFERMLRSGSSEPGAEPRARAAAQGPGSLAASPPAVATALPESGEQGPIGRRRGSAWILAAGALMLVGGAAVLSVRLRASPGPAPGITEAVRAGDAGLAAVPPVAASKARIRWAITSQPAGALVLRGDNGQRLGRTPWEQEQPQAPGEELLLLRRDGFEDEPVTLPRDRDSVVHKRLHPIRLPLPDAVAPTAPSKKKPAP